MSIESHHQSLGRKHEALELKIREEELRPMPNSIELANLKKQKLSIKEEMTREEVLLAAQAS
jgi:hypothetical protein